MKAMKKVFAVVVLAAATFGIVQALTPATFAINCSIVRCPGCPDGYMLKPTGNNCCRCVPIR